MIRTSDDTLRELERAALAGDAVARWRWRIELVRAGRADEAGIEKGDEVLVEERESPWVVGPWEGVVMKHYLSGEESHHGGDGYVRPLLRARSLVWRSGHAPSPEYLEAGIYLTHNDRRTLLRPVAPRGVA